MQRSGNHKKPILWLFVFSLLIGSAVALLFLTGPGPETNATENTGKEDTESVTADLGEALLAVESDHVQTLPYENFLWGESWSEGGWFTMDGTAVSRQFSQIVGEIPVFTYHKDLRISYGENVSPKTIAVYGADFYKIYSDATTKDLNKLPEGDYYLVITVEVQGDYIEQAAADARSGYECVYRMVVTG